MGTSRHTARQPEPSTTSFWQAPLGGQGAGQAPVMPAAKPVSQVSPASTMALPHTTGQSGSLMAEAPVGQQKSPALAVVMSPWKQMALQVLADSKRSAVQKLVSGQSLAPGQAPERPTATAVSQNSPGSMV